MKTSQMMNPLPLTLSLQFIFWIVFTAADDSIKSHPSEEVKLRIVDKNKDEFDVTLKKSVSFIANENLPVWTVRGNTPNVLIPDFEVMNKIGQFSMYQNSDHSSAAVYFHKLHEFYGIIDVRFILKAIRLEDIKNQFEIKFSTNHGVQERDPCHYNHRKSRSTDKTDYLLSIDTSSMIGAMSLNNTQSLVRSQRDVPDVVYVKTLIIVNYDLLITIIPEFLTNIEIVHYLLILFNNVDMLYSKIGEPKIKINIAGIIIGTDRRSFPSLTRCHREKNDGSHINHFMDASCTNSAVQSYLRKHSKVIPPDSYNVAIFLTSYRLYENVPTLKNFLGGLTFVPTLGPYSVKKCGFMIGPVISVYHKKYFGNFHVISHEIAHGLRVHSHDKEPYVDEDGNCHAYLMKRTSDFCENCLSWSHASRESLKKFFSSRNRCFYINKPQSLMKSGPREMLTADEQCQCYGYKSAGTSRRSLWDKIRQIPTTNMCKMRLRCYDQDGKSHTAIKPLDGTLCGEDMDGISKVCWHKECERVEKYEEGKI